eukprot:TRINITY_DN11567_c0_g1_i1.p1 TRINITY_DN11567_c0_g1~~TRINITY_DN11567_c0_g1_i1.p1  ORF type:complete len:803 (+),score=86.79 TRINITY_DN11567_c0_g1_i1:130-2538(+)
MHTTNKDAPGVLKLTRVFRCAYAVLTFALGMCVQHLYITVTSCGSLEIGSLRGGPWHNLDLAHQGDQQNALQANQSAMWSPQSSVQKLRSKVASLLAHQGDLQKAPRAYQIAMWSPQSLVAPIRKGYPQACKASGQAFPSMAFVFRSYAGHAGMMHRILTNMGMFVPDSVERIVVLDAESAADHIVGDTIEAQYSGVRVEYEQFPHFNLAMRGGKTLGYARQLWSSFYVDKWTDADIIGLIDADAQVINLLRPDLVFDDTGKIIVRSHGPDHWEGANFVGAGNKVDAMWVDHMPFFLWKHTFSNFREYLRKRHNVSSYDEAFQMFNMLNFSPINMIYQYAVAHEKKWYALNQIAVLDREHLPKMIGTNKPSGTNRVQRSCCLVYNLSESICPHPHSASEAEIQPDMDYRVVHSYLDCLRRELSPAMVDNMRTRCMVLLTSQKWKPRSEDLGAIRKGYPQACKASGQAFPSMAFVFRSYAGHAGMMHRILTNMGMFVPDSVERIVVLDAESAADHIVGDTIEAQYSGVRVEYEQFPHFNLAMRGGKTLGYARQLWSSFYVDKWTDADIIGLIDADAQVINLLRPDLVFDDTGKIIVRSHGPDHWEGANFVGAGNKVDAMWVDHMPFFLWKHTFSNFREYLRKRHNVSSYDEAFQMFNMLNFSPINMIYQYAVAHEKKWYALNQIAVLDREHLPKMIGTNKPSGTNRVQRSCCLVYNLSESICPHPHSASEAEIQPDMDYRVVHSYLDCLRRELSPAMVDNMRTRCMVLLTSQKWKPRSEDLGAIRKGYPQACKASGQIGRAHV